MREVSVPDAGPGVEVASFLACVATVIELPFDALPQPGPGEDPATGWTVTRWLGGLGLGLVAVAEPTAFSWPGPWIGRADPGSPGRGRAVVMFGVPSGVIWDPSGADGFDPAWIAEGFLVAAADIALARPARPVPPATAGSVEAICVAPSAGEPAELLESVRAIPGRGLEGDRHVIGAGTFPSGPPGSALTLIAAEVCESFSPPLEPSEHRRNLVTRGIDLNGLVGQEFSVGAVRCRGMRLCEPCTVVQRYAGRAVLRALVHRGGLRADILTDGRIHRGDPVRVSAG
jgi:hypothetical protein